jgi:hypothetical protein
MAHFVPATRKATMPKPDLDTALRYAATCVYGSEGFRATAFLDTLATVPVWTIGHGTTQVDGVPVNRQDASTLVLTVAHDAGTDLVVPLLAGAGQGFW